VQPAELTHVADTRNFRTLVRDNDKSGEIHISETTLVEKKGPILLSPKPTEPTRHYIVIFAINTIGGEELEEPIGGQLTEDLFAEAKSLDEVVAIAKVFFFHMWNNLNAAFWSGKLQGVKFKRT